ncbi:family 16 glycoside hydrolase, partial [Ligaoa zhengdingensis]
MSKSILKRTLSVVLSAAMICSPLTAFAQGESGAKKLASQNYYSNQGELNETAFIQLPMGAVKAEDWLLQQMYYQKNGLTGNLQENYSIYGPNNGWRGGNGDNWEKGPYFLRGLVSLAWTLDDQELKDQAMEWLDFILESQQSTGYFGPKAHGDGTGTGWDWWPHMVVIQTLRDYYEATELEGNPDERVLPLFENYFRFQLEQLPRHHLASWAASRGGDNVEVVLWYYNRVYDPANPSESEWLIDLAKLLESQTISQNSSRHWTDIFTNTTSREHVVNTTQAMKTPAVIWQFTGDDADRNALREGLRNMGIDHGRIDNLANSDEAARDNYPYRGSETCSVVESLLSNEIALKILGEGWIGDEIESLAYNNLPVCYTPDFTGHVYYQAQNQVMATHGWHEFDCDHGDDLAFGAPGGFECCFPNMHMGWPKFVQTMYMATTDNGLAVISYGPNSVEAKVADGKTAKFHQVTDYPFKDSITLNYEGDTASFPLKLRVPEWCDAPSFSVNGTPVTGDIVDGFITIDREWTAGDVVEVQFPMEVRVSNWYNDSVAVQYGTLTFSLKIEEDWRTITDFGARDDSRKPASMFENREVYPASDWNYGLVIDPDDPASSFTVEVADEISLQPFTLANAPITIKAVGQKIPEWKLKGNVVPEPPYSPIAANTALQEEVELVPYGATRLRITQIPVIGDAPADLTTTKTIDDAEVYVEDGEKVVEFDNVNVRSADNYTLKVNYTGTGSLKININSKYEETYEFNGEPIVIENLNNIVPTALPFSSTYFRFGYGKYNNIRFIGDSDVEITGIQVVPVNPFTAPEIKSAKLSQDGSTLTVNTNIDRSAGFYTVEYGTESGNYTHTVENLYSNTATISGLSGSDTYYVRVSMLANGVPVTTEEVKASVGGSQTKPDFYDDFSDSAASREKWSLYDPNGVVTFEDGKMTIGVSNNIKVVTGEQGWGDFAVVTKMQGVGDPTRDFGIMIRSSNIMDGADGYNGYYVGINPAGGGGLNIGYADGGWHQIATPKGFTYEDDHLYELKVIMAGERLVAYVDGAKIYDELVSNMTSGGNPVPLYKAGGAGFRSWNQGFEIEEFQVREISDAEYAELGIENNLFKDDFSDPTASAANWEVIGEEGIVAFEEGRMTFGASSNIKAVVGEEEWADYAIEATLTGPAVTDRDFGVMFRATNVGDGADGYNGYYVGINPAGGGGLNVGYANGGWNDIAKPKGFTYEPGHPYELKILVCGDMFKVYVDGEFIYELEDGKFPAGKVGLRSWNQPFEADFFRVRNLTEAEKALFPEPDPDEPLPTGPSFSDNFDDTAVSAANWNLIGDTSKMSFADGKLVFGSSNNVKATAGDESWTDYVAEVSIALNGTSTQNAGIMYRVTGAASGADSYNGYFFGIGNDDNGGYVIRGYANGSWSQTNRFNVGEKFADGEEHQLKVVCYGEKFALYLDGELVDRYSDNRFTKGQIGLRSYTKTFTADNVVVRAVTEEDLVDINAPIEVKEGISAHKTVQLFIPNFASSRRYKIVYGTEPGVYTHTVADLTASGHGSEKLAFTVPENDVTYYARAISINGAAEEAISEEIAVKSGYRLDISDRLEALEAQLAEAMNVEDLGYTSASWNRLTWAIDFANKVLSDPNSNLIDASLAKNSLLIGMNELEKDEDRTVSNIAFQYSEGVSAYLINGNVAEEGSNVLVEVTLPFGGELDYIRVVETVPGDPAAEPIIPEEYDDSSAAEGATRYRFTMPAYDVTIQVKLKGAEELPDKAELLELYNENKDRKEADYLSGWDAFEQALVDAKTVLDDPAASQADVNGAKSALEDAIAGLQGFSTVRYEAEDALVEGSPIRIEERSDASGGAKVGGIDNATCMVTFTVNAPKAGDYKVVICADGSPSYPNPSHIYYVNGDVDNAKIVNYPDPEGWNIWKLYEITVALNEGDNTITFKYNDTMNATFAELDYIDLIIPNESGEIPSDVDKAALKELVEAIDGKY